MLRVHASKFVRTVSLLPVLIVLGVVGLEYYQFVIVRIVNGTLSRDGGPAVIVAEMIIFHVFIALVLASFARVVLTDPGYVTPEVIATLQDEVQSAMEAQGVDLVELHDLASMSFCRRCRQAKPMRAHHCSVCDRCVLKMDHHCPWVGNCIGARNYKYFLLFVSYAFLATSMIVITLFGQFQRSFIETPHAGDDVLPFAGIIAVVVAIALALSLLIFICVHGSLLRFGSSTIECHIFGTKSPYNRGLQANCRAVFGDGPMWRWLLPVPQNFAHGSQGAAYLLELQRFRAEQLVGDDEAERFL